MPDLDDEADALIAIIRTAGPVILPDRSCPSFVEIHNLVWFRYPRAVIRKTITNRATVSMMPRIIK